MLSVRQCGFGSTSVPFFAHWADSPHRLISDLLGVVGGAEVLSKWRIDPSYFGGAECDVAVVRGAVFRRGQNFGVLPSKEITGPAGSYCLPSKRAT